MSKENWVPFDKRNAAILNEMGFSITDEPGHGETASVEGEMAVYVVQLADGRLRLSIDLPEGSISADIVDLHEELIAGAGTGQRAKAMAWTREKHVAAILNDVDPRVARAADALLDAGLIRQVGERRDDDTGKMRPVYQFIKTAENKGKWIETLCALPSNVLDAFGDSLCEGAVDAADEKVDWFEGKPECRRTDMDKTEVSRQLRALVEERLFGNGPWSSDDPAVNSAISDKLSAWGLQTVDPVTQDIHTTELGSELQVELMSVFMGHHEPYEAPDYLRISNLITPAQSHELTTRFEDGERPEDLLPPLLRRLWRQHFNHDAPTTQ